MSEATWHSVRDRVLRLRDAPGADEVFGGFAHRFALAPPLSEAEVQEAERALRVRLPDEYRSFLLNVGAGGAGPAYGVLTLRRAAHGWEWDADSTHRIDVDRLREPYSPQHIGGQPIDPLQFRPLQRYDFEYYDDYQAAQQRWEDTLWHPDRTAGAVCLCDAGCLRRYWLVVTGDDRGAIWRDYRIDGIDLAPMFDGHGHRLTFSRWYLDWLSDAEMRAGADPSAH